MPLRSRAIASLGLRIRVHLLTLKRFQISVERSLQARRISAFGGRKPIIVGDVAVVGTEDRLIRIVGIERPIDVFYVPNELEAVDFERVWERGIPIQRGFCSRIRLEHSL